MTFFYLQKLFDSLYLILYFYISFVEIFKFIYYYFYFYFIIITIFFILLIFSIYVKFNFQHLIVMRNWKFLSW